MPEYKILTTQCEIEFTGKYRRDLETNNWHYYEKDDGTIIHFRKEHMVAVRGDTAESIKANKLPLDLLSHAIKILKDMDLCDGDVCTLKELLAAVAIIDQNWRKDDQTEIEVEADNFFNAKLKTKKLKFEPVEDQDGFIQ